MTRRSRERRAAAGEGGQPAAASPHYDAYEERRLAEEVLYLHSLWRSGPPAPAPASALAPAPPSGATRASPGVSRATRARPNQRKRRRIERPAAEPEEPGADWPLAPSPPASPSPASWPDAAPSSPAPRPQQQQQPSPASLAQRDALRAAEEFFSGRGSSGEDGDGDDEDEGSEPEDGGDAAAGFFLGLFERDAALRGYYERSHEEGEFRCMGCVGRRTKGSSRSRRFRNCISLVHHAHDAKRCGRPLAHRALAAAVCRVLGWDVTRLPSIVIDPRGTLGQALLAREGASAAAATAQEAKDNVDSGESGRKDASKEDVGLEKNGSLTDDKKEDVDSAMNEGPLSDGDAAKEDVDSIMSDGPLSDGDAAKEDVDSIMSDGPLSDGDAAKEDVDKGKIGAPSNNNRGEVHEQGNGTETAEKEYDVVKALAPAPAGGSRASTNRRKRRKIECSAEPEEGPDWSLAPSLPAPTSPSSRPDATLSSPTPRQQGREPSPALLAQQDALHAAKAFFSGRGTSGEEDDGVNEAAGFFLGLFERDATLRGYYERSHKEGEFLCMGCVGMSVKRGGSRRFRDCASLVQHARAVTRCGRPQAHRALAGVVCRVLGWNIKRLPNIVIDPRGTLGQALLVREGEGTAAATAQEAKENVNIVDNDGTDAVKEDTNDIHPLSSKDTNDMDPLNSKDTPKELCKAVQEEGAICKKQEYAKSADDMGDTCNVRLENNSSKEKAATENKEEHTDGVVDSGDDIGNLGNNLTDSSKS